MVHQIYVRSTQKLRRSPFVLLLKYRIRMSREFIERLEARFFFNVRSCYCMDIVLSTPSRSPCKKLNSCYVRTISKLSLVIVQKCKEPSKRIFPFQVTKAGDIATRVTMGIAASSAHLEMPDLMLLARPELQLFALLPLKFVRLYIHDESRFQLKVRLANGRTFYLQLLTHPLRQNEVFGHWVRLLYRLRFYRSNAPLTYEKETALHHRRHTFI
uniref:Golgi associated RAB2 interactor 5A n=1 Tax=Naja naja TaxID=35670 RepID=A0A8C6Y4Q5_NAJNA